jgi:hypothetical protein
MKLHGIPHDLPERWNGLTWPEFVQLMLEFEHEVDCIETPKAWLRWCQLS